jgi:hypothetical protein
MDGAIVELLLTEGAVRVVEAETRLGETETIPAAEIVGVVIEVAAETTLVEIDKNGAVIAVVGETSEGLAVALVAPARKAHIPVLLLAAVVQVILAV